MKSRSISTSSAWVTLTLLLLVVVTALVWANLQWLENIPQESEFFYRWQVTRGLIFDRANPYEPRNGYVFTAPFPALFFYFPFALVENFEFARSLWITALQIVAVIFAYQCFRNTSWGVNRWQASAILVFALLWFPAFSIYIRGSDAIFLAALFAAALLAIQKGQAEFAGVLFTLSALELRLTILGVVLVLIWMIAQRKWIFFFWAGVTFLFTSGLGLIFLPGWPVDFFWATLRYTDFHIGQVIIETTTRWWPGIGAQVGWGLVILAALILIIEWWLVWRKNIRRLTWTLGLTWVIAIWIGFEINLDHVFLLLLSLVIIFSAWNRRWGKTGLIFNWISIALILPGLWWAFLFFVQRETPETYNPILMILFPLMVLLGLYWIRWWYLRPEYLDLSES